MPHRDDTKPEMLGVKLGKEALRAEIASFLMTQAEHFVQLHGGRGSGKSYTTQKTVIADCLANNREFMLTVPTQKLVDQGALRKWTSKVLGQQFPAWQTHTTTQYLYMRRSEEDDWQPVGRCQALSMVEDAKNDSSVFRTDWMIWDEAMRVNLSPELAESLIEMFLYLYHTIDRDENRVKAVFLGNALNKTDPLYQFFGVDLAKLKKPGTVVRTFNRVSWYVPVPPDLDEDPDNAFRQMVKGTRYGDMASGHFDVSYGYLIADPGDTPVTSCCAIKFTEDGWLLVMMADRCVYIQSCGPEWAQKYAQRSYVVSYRDATKDAPTVPPGLLNTIRYALAAGCCKFVDEESLLVGSAKLKMCFNISVMG